MHSFLLGIWPFLVLHITFAAPVITKRSISGPVITDNFPDPSIIQAGNTWYAFSTGSGGRNVPVATSPDGDSWVLSDQDALPRVGGWSNGMAIWAPDVVRLPGGGYVLYYSAYSSQYADVHCFGAATSANPNGPFEPRDEAIACAQDQGGAIDPSGFTDFDGRQYVIYKVDGNNFGSGGNCNNGVSPIKDTPILLQEVSAQDGYSPVGGVTTILDRSDADGPLVEAPSLVRVQDSGSANGWLYVLFFSSNCYAGPDYDVSYATSRNGISNGGAQYTKSSSPLLITGSNGGLYSPGGLDIATDASHVLFHADLGTTAAVRQLYAGRVSIDIASGTVSI